MAEDTRYSGGAYRDWKDYTNAKPEPFEDQIKRNKRDLGPIQLELPLAKKKRKVKLARTKKTNSVNEA